MRKLIAINQVSLDGVMQSPGGPTEDPRGGFALGGWSMPYRSENLGQRLIERVSGDYDLLLGRRTYEIFSAFWPYAGSNPIADGFNSATKYVATRTRPALTWRNSVALGGDAVEAVRELKAAEGPEIHIYGSASFLQALIAADLVDEHELRVAPVVLGSGKRLFEPGAPPRGLRLVEVDHAPTGVVFLRYVPDGAVKTVPEMAPASEAEAERRRAWAAEG